MALPGVNSLGVNSQSSIGNGKAAKAKDIRSLLAKHLKK